VKEVVSGSAQIEGNQSTHLQITTSDKAIIHYDSFTISENQKVTFIQPKSTSAVLNRVKGGDPSFLMGQLNANGRVFLINPNGVIIGPSGSINASSFIASALDIADEDFLNDRFQFSLKPGSENSGIINQGHISCPEGAVALLAPHIRNEGVIMAQAGKVVLTGGEKVTLDFSGDSLMSFSVEGEVKEAVIEHLGKIEAPGGQVFLKIKVADEALKRIVNADGLEEASQMIEENGVIRLVGKSTIAADVISIDGSGKTKIDVKGSLDVSRMKQGEAGGSVQIFGDRISLEGAEILALGEIGGGSVLIGGDYQGLGDMQKANTLTMDSTSTIHADALTRGDGGKVILWSKESTQFNGKIFAQGGKESGNGGLIETSGKEKLDVSVGYVNTLALYGKAGNWLLDPLSINVITGGGGTLAQGALCSDVVTALTIDPATINAAASNVTLCASSSITFSNDVAMASPNVGITCTAASGAAVPITLSTANIVTSGGSLIFNGAVTLTTDVLVDTTSGGGIPIGAPVSFVSTIDASAPGAHNLTVTAGSGGDVFVGGTIGTTALGALTLSGDAGIEVANISTTAAGGKSGNIVLSSMAGLFLNGSTYTSFPSGGTSGSLTLNGGVTLGFVGNTTFTTTNAPITINGDVNVPNATITNGFVATTSNGNFIFNGDVGSTNNQGIGNSRLSNFNVATGTGTISLGNVGNAESAILGPFTLNSATQITLNGSFYNTNGPHSYTGPIILGPAALSELIGLTSANNPITFGATSTIDAASSGIQGLNINAGTALVTFGGAIGSTTPLSELLVDGLSGGTIRINATTLTTVKDQLYGLQVILGADASFTTTNSPITFKSTIDGAHNFIVAAGTGAIFIGGVVGSVAPPHQISLTGEGGILLSGNITTSTAAGTFTAIGNVAESTSVTITTSSATVLISGTVDSAVNGAAAFGVDTSSGGGGNITIVGDIGTAKSLTGLTLNAGTGAIAVGGVGNIAPGSTMGLTFTAGGGITLNGSGYTTSGGSQNYNSNVSLGTITSLVSSNASINFGGTINGAKGLTVNSGTSSLLFGSTVGDTIPLSYLISMGTGTITATGNVTTVGDQFYNSNMNLAADTTFTTTSSPVNFLSTVDGAHNFLVSTSTGTISVAGVIGGITPVHQVSLSGLGGILLAGNVTTSTAAGTVTVTGHMTITTSASITTNSAAVLITGAVSDNLLGTSTLAIDTSSGGGANITIVGDIGTVNSLAGLVLNAGSSTLAVGGVGNVDPGSTGGLVFTAGGGITLNGSGYTTSGFGQFYNNNVTLGTTTSLTSTNQTINFMGTVNGAQGLTLNPGVSTVLLSSTVGDSTPLDYLISLGGGTIATNGSITTTGGQLYSSAVSLGADTTFTTTNSPILFTSTIDGAYNLLVNAGNGEISVERDVGTLVAVHQVSLTGTAGIKLGGNVTTATSSGTFTAIGSVAVSTSIAITTNSAAAIINGNIDATVPGVGTLTIDTSTGGGANITIAGSIGALSSFSGIAFNAGTGALSVGGVGGPIAGSTGGLTFTGGAGITLSGGVYMTSGSGQLYNNNVTLSKTISSISTNQPITFAGTVNGAVGLTTNAGTSTLLFSSTVGNGTPLTNLICQGTGTTTATGNITTIGVQSYAPAVTLAADTTFTTTNSPILFANTIDGAYNFIVNAGSGGIVIQRAIGSLVAVHQISLIGTGGIELGGNVTTATSAGTFTVVGSVAVGTSIAITTNSAAAIINGNIDGTVPGVGTITIDTTIGGGANITIAGNIGALSSFSGITFNAGTGALSVGGIGGPIAGSTGGLTFTASGGVTLNGSSYMTSGAGQTYNNNVTLGKTTSFVSNNQSINFVGTFDGTVSGAQGLTVNIGTGALLFSSTVGSSIPLTNLVCQGTGTTTVTGNITTVGGQRYSPAVTLAADTTFTTSNAPISFTGTVDGAHNFLVSAGTGAISIGGVVGGATPVHQTSLTGRGGILLGGNITTSTGAGTFTATGDVAMNTNVAITTSSAAVLITGSVDNTTAGSGALTVNTSSGGGANITITGAIGTAQSLTGLTLNAGTGDLSVGGVGGSVAGSTGGLTFTAGGSITLTGNGYTTSGSGQTYSTNMTIGATTSMTSTNQPITFSGTVNGAHGLTVNTGTSGLSFNSTVGNSTPLTYLMSLGSGTIATNGNITTMADQLYFSPVTIGTNALFATTDSPITFISTIDGAHNLTVTTGRGSIFVGSAVGGMTPLHSVTMTGDGGITIDGITTTSGVASVSLSSLARILMSANINTAAGVGTVLLGGDVSLNANVAIITSASTVTIDGDIDGVINAMENFTIDTTNGGSSPAGASVVIAGNIGSRKPLISLGVTTGTTGTISLGNVGTTAPGIVSGLNLSLNSLAPGIGIFLNGSNYNTSGGPQHFTGNVQLATTATMTSNNGNILFDNKIDGASANIAGLILDAGTGSATLGGTIGSTDQLLFVTITAAGGININNGGVTTLNNQLYNNPVTLGANATFTTTNSLVSFLSTINGNAAGRSLNINVANGTIFVGGAIGSTGTPIGSITMVGDGGITLNGIGIGTSGIGAVNISSLGGILFGGSTYNALSQTYTGAATLQTATTMTSAAGQDITIEGMINGDGISTHDLSITAPGGGIATVAGTIGDVNPLGNLTIAANDINIGGIGGVNIGVTGVTNLNALANINFAGSNYFTNAVNYIAGTNFNILQLIPTDFHALTGPILFINGSLNLPNLTSSVIITTTNANIIIPKLIGISKGHFLASAGTGIVNVGDNPGPTFTDIFIQGGSVTLTGPLTANSITIYSDTGISTTSSFNILQADGVILLNALGGDVGSIGIPIEVNSTGLVVCGASGSGFYHGATGDGTVHCLPSNPPTQLTYNMVSIGCAATFVPPICPTCPSTCPPLTCPPTSTPQIPPSVIAVPAFLPGTYNAFDFNLASDFFFLEDRAADCVGDYTVFNSLREPDEKCTYDHIFWIPPKGSKLHY